MNEKKFFGELGERHPFRQAALRCGYNCIAAVCKAAGAHPTQVADILYGRKAPIRHDGTLNAQVVRVCEVLGETPEKVFPYAYPVPDAPVSCTQAVRDRGVLNILNVLTDRERVVVRKIVLEGLTFRELSSTPFEHRFEDGRGRIRIELCRVSEMRIRQIYIHAMAKLRSATLKIGIKE